MSRFFGGSPFSTCLDPQELPFAVSKHADDSESVVELMAVDLLEGETIPEAVVEEKKAIVEEMVMELVELMALGLLEMTILEAVAKLMAETIPEKVVELMKLMAVCMVGKKTIPEAVVELMVEKNILNVLARNATQESAEPQARKSVCQMEMLLLVQCLCV